MVIYLVLLKLHSSIIMIPLHWKPLVLSTCVKPGMHAPLSPHTVQDGLQFLLHFLWPTSSGDQSLACRSLREAKTFPKDAFCQTQTAHGHYDDQGSFWNVMGCMRGSDSEDHPGPHVAYYPYKIPNAQARFQINYKYRLFL